MEELRYPEQDQGPSIDSILVPRTIKLLAHKFLLSRDSVSFQGLGWG